MAAYVVSLVNVTDPEQYQAYASLAGPAVAKHGGKFLTRGAETIVMEGAFDYGRLVIAEFESVVAAETFYTSPEYQEARLKRLRAADFNMVIAPGA